MSGWNDPLANLDEAHAQAPAPQAPAPGMPVAPGPYLDGLNPEQREAVLAVDGPVLVLAGAGTGKTRVLTTRIAHLIATRKAYPSQILSVTFTNRAAREMHDRIGTLIGGMVEGMPWLGTFHSIAAKILRRHAELVGLKTNFSILDDEDQLRLLKQLVQAENIDEKRWPARQLLGLIDRWKNRGLSPDRVSPHEASDFANGKAVELYQAYQDRLKVLNACDFGDLLLHNVTIFQTRADVLADFQRRFKFILVDEYQDTNVIQYLWLRLLAQGQRNICCVGDDDQSIYGWRGAEVGNILRFEKDFPGAKVIRLERNYRSTPHILGAASGLIAANQGRLGKTLWTDIPEGEQVAVKGVWDGMEEAREVADTVENLQRSGYGLNDMAILVRAGFQTREFEDRFLTLGVPYRVIGGVRFYERMEIRDAIAYLRVVHQADDDLAFERIINKPKRGLGDASLQALHKTARRDQISLYAAARRLIETDELPTKARTTLRNLTNQFEQWRSLANGMDHIELTGLVLDESGYTAMWQADKSPEAPGRLENLKELVRALEGFENLTGFLEHVALVMENEERQGEPMISLMTLHAAKGLEFKVVFLPGWEEGLFPHPRALDESGLAGLEEERRLAYVGLTRARERAYISHAANRRTYGSWNAAVPSRFLAELPEDHVEADAAKGLYGGVGFGQMSALANQDYGSSYETPGWRRAQAARDGGMMRKNGVIDAVAEHVTSSDPDRARFATGERVFHQKFGYGRIRLIEGSKLTIDFEKAGEKKVIDSFVTRA